MQCAVVVDQKPPLRVVQRERATAPPGGLLLKTSYAGVCHSDAHNLKSVGKFEGMVLGHEISGVVEQMGSAVPTNCPVKVGDKVMIYPWRGCAKCDTCIGGYSVICEDTTMPNVGIGRNHGGYSTHVPVPEWELAFKVPDAIPMDVASILPCSALTAWVALNKADAAIQRAIRLRQKANLLVIGAGGLGSWCISLAKMRFQNDDLVRIICIDISEEKLATAREMGAEETIFWEPNAREDDMVSAITVSGKIDAAIDFVGSTQTARVGLDSLYKGSTLILIGLHDGTLQTPIPLLVGKTINVQGHKTGRLCDLKELIEYLSTHTVKYPPVEYHALAEINDVIHMLEAGKINGRALLKFEE